MSTENNNPYSDIEIGEILARYNILISKYTQLALEIAPLLEKFGKYKEEIQLITAEFVKRKFIPEDPQQLMDKITEELEKRK